MGKDYMQTSAAYYDGKGIWFASINMNGFFYYDIEKDITTLVTRFKDEEIWKENMFFSIKKIGDFLYFIPFDYKYFAFYDLKKSEMKYYSPTEKYCRNLSYFHLWVKNNFLYVLPRKLTDPIIKIKCSDNTAEEIYKWSEGVKTGLKDKNACEIITFAEGEDYIWISIAGEDEIYKIKTDSWEAEKKTIDKITNPAIYNINAREMLIADIEERAIYSVDMKFNAKKKYKADKDTNLSGIAVLKNGQTVILPHNFGRVYIYDDEKLLKEIDLKGISGFEDTYKKDVHCIYFYLEIKNELWLLPCRGNAVVIINLEDYSARAKKIPYPKNIGEEELRIIEKMQNSVSYDDEKIMINELDREVLENLIKAYGNKYNKCDKNKKSAGQNIHENIMKAIW